MNFTYGLKKSSEIIKNYKIKDNKIIINFLDGSFYKVDNTKENMDNILNMMLEQAIERDNTDALNATIRSKNSSVAISISNLIVSASTCVLAYNSPEECQVVIYTLGGILFVSSIALGTSSIPRSCEIDELKKYRLFLSIKDKLDEKANDLNLYNGVKNKKKLNIGTLDDFSLSDLKKIRTNLNRSYAYSLLSVTNEKTKKLK